MGGSSDAAGVAVGVWLQAQLEEGQRVSLLARSFDGLMMCNECSNMTK